MAVGVLLGVVGIAAPSGAAQLVALVCLLLGIWLMVVRAPLAGMLGRLSSISITLGPKTGTGTVPRTTGPAERPEDVVEKPEDVVKRIEHELEGDMAKGVTLALGRTPNVRTESIAFVETQGSGGSTGKILHDGREIDQAKVLAEGSDATARVTAVKDTDVQMRGMRFMNLSLEIDQPGVSARTMPMVPTLVPEDKRDRAVPGATLPVKIDRADPSVVVVDWGRVG